MNWLWGPYRDSLIEMTFCDKKPSPIIIILTIMISTMMIAMLKISTVKKLPKEDVSVCMY